jgi:hypothetical protein
LLVNNLKAAKTINVEYDKQFRLAGAAGGQTINIRKPAYFLGRLGQAANPEAIQETSVPLTLSYQRGIDTLVSSQDLTLNIDEYAKRIGMPKMAKLANDIDSDVLNLVVGLNNYVGTPGTTPTALDTYWGAKTRLDNLACPTEDRWTILNPVAQQKIGNALYTNFNPTREISEIYRTGDMGYALGSDWAMDQNVYVHTVGVPGSSTPLVNGANQVGSSIITDGWSSTTLNQGDTVQFSVKAVNPQSKKSTGEVASFVVTQTVTDSSGALTIPISPAIVGPGSPLQNVDALPADNAVITVWGVGTGSFATISGKVTPQNLMYQRDFGTLACVDMPLPGGTDVSERAKADQLAISLRVIRQYQSLTDQWLDRTELLYGTAVLRQELACRVAA